jgi:hypothetical protein
MAQAGAISTSVFAARARLRELTSGLSTELVWRERTVAAAMTRGVYVFHPCIVVGKA